MDSTTRRLGSVALWMGLVVAWALPAGAVLSTTAVWQHNGPGGAAVTTAGDFNCDGVADLLVGFPDADGFPGTTGGTWTSMGWIGVWFGGASLPPQPTGAPDWTAVAFSGLPGVDLEGARSGTAVAAGDVNRDGCDDVIASAPGVYAAGELVNVYFGSASGPSTSFDWRRFTSASTGARFGASVASGDVNGDGTADIVIGAPQASFGQSEEGAVLVWLGSQFLDSDPDGDASDVDWLGQSDQASAHLGESVAAAGDVDGDGDDEILAGAPDWDSNLGGPVFDAGIALMWNGHPTLQSSPDGTRANAPFHFELAAAGARLGASVASAGDLDGDGFADLLLGAPNFDSPFVAGPNNGTVVAVRGSATGALSDVVSWSHIGLGNGGRLGASLATAGDVNGDGRADYLMGEPGLQRMQLVLGRTTFGPNPPADATYTQASAGYGSSVGTAGDWNDDGFSDVVVGAPVSSQVFVYLGAGDTLATASTPALQGIQDGDIMGLGMGYAGDINHDGCSDVVAGAPNWDGGQTDEGRIFVRYGMSDACSSFDEIIFPGDREGNQNGAQLGWSVTGAGDVNGDGYADVIAGAPFHDGLVLCGTFPIVFCPTPDSGRAYVFLGGASGLAFSPSTVLEGLEETGAQFGSVVASAGDVNGDGYGDVIVGAPYVGNGRAFLYLGSASGLSASHSWSASGSTPDARFGFSVAGVGDVNGDGYGDVLVGAENHAGGLGGAFLYLGQPTQPSNPKGLGALPVRTYTGAPGSSFGRTVAGAGDVNRDGFSDFAIGAPTHDSSGFGMHEGRVTVYHGAPTNALPTLPIVVLFGDAPTSDAQRFGSGIAGGGDVNGDGFGDLLVGDQWHSGPAGFAQGKAYIFHGSVFGLGSIAARSFEDCGHGFCDFGRDVALAGDVDGDGFADALIAAFGDDSPGTDRGSVYAHFGNNGRGMPLLPLQARAFGGSPTALLGAVTNFFEASMQLHSPAGRTNVSMELEVKSLGVEFDNQGVSLGAFEDNVLFDRGALTLPIGVGQEAQWRARLRSASPLFGTSRWIHLPGNTARELDVRMVPEPEALLGLAAGGAALALLARRRMRTMRAAARSQG
jgi:hypothetical protein